MNQTEAIQAAASLDELNALTEMLKGVAKTLIFAASDDNRWDKDALTGIGGTLIYASSQLLHLKEALNEKMALLFESDDGDTLDLAASDVCGLGELFACVATGNFEHMDPVPFTMAERFVSNIAEKISELVSTLQDRHPKLPALMAA